MKCHARASRTVWVLSVPANSRPNNRLAEVLQSSFILATMSRRNYERSFRSEWTAEENGGPNRALQAASDALGGPSSRRYLSPPAFSA
jgi:hypothetical protein